MTLGRKLRTWRGLDSAVRRAVWSALPTLLAVGVSIRLLGFPRTHRLASPAVARRAGPGDAERLAAGARLAARALPWRPRCLERSLALTYLLRRRGLPARLRIGVRKRVRDQPSALRGPAIEAHAWVEVEGRVIGDRADVHDRFLAFDDDLAEATAALAVLRR